MKKLFLLSAFAFCIYSTTWSQVTYPVNGPTDPRHITYAFVNAHIVTDYKTSIDSASMIIRDGIIVEVGKGLMIPKDAVVYDLKGKYIYPSFIDIFGDYGLPEVVKRPRRGWDEENAGMPQYNTNTKGAYGWNQAVRPEYDAYKNFTIDARRADSLRKAGFGTVNCINKDGVVRGTSVLVLLGEGKENDFVLRDRATANYSFDKGSSGQNYPGSLMGSIALIRQTYYDAQWYVHGGYKKEYNISLDAWNGLQKLPQIFDAGNKLNELRADRIAKEFGVNYIIKGSGDEYQRIEDIKAMNAPVIVPLNFPEAFDMSDPYEAINITLAQLKHWELAPTNAGALEKAGVSFAFTSSDLKSKGDFIKNLRKAMEYGLSEQAALKALTQTPAELLKIADRVGSLKKGMTANFIITSKNIFDKDNIIYDNWVKGARYKIADYDLKDLRGTYSLRAGTLAPLKIRVGGELQSPDMNLVVDDSSQSKVTYSRQGSLITLQFELKKKEGKGIYRFSGTSETPEWKGTGQLPDGSWVAWTMKLDSAYVPQTKPDSAKKELKTGAVTYPFIAYGWTTPPSAKKILFKNATVWTNEQQGILQNTDVLIADGKIIKIGRNITAPDAEVVDATGKHLTSGIIDEHSHIAVNGGANEGTQASSAEVRIGDVINSEDIQIYRQLAGGVTTSHILHGSANPIGGQTQLIKLRWGLSPEKMKFANWPGYIKFALGENVKQSNWGDRQVIRYPQTRLGVEQVYLDFFTRAKEYDAAWNKFKVQSSKFKAENAGETPPRRDLELEALAEILNSKRFITCHSYVQSEINMLMHIADTFGFKVNTFTHILEGYKVADKMKKHGVLGASTFSDWWAYKFEVYEAIPYNGALMKGVGLTVAFNSDDAEMARRLNQEAAKAVKYGGVSEEEAWKFVTLNPAKMLRIDNSVGSIKEGKDADLVLWDENPLSIYARPLQTYVDGVKYFDVNTDINLREGIQAERARLTQKSIEAKSKGEQTQRPGKKALVLYHCVEEEFVY